MKIYSSITDLIGRTPLLHLKGYEKTHNIKAQIIGKLENLNPGGSVKDRIAKAMLKDALEKGVINKNTVIVEPTSGNTGIGLAQATAALGLNLVIVMPDSMSKERRALLRAYGARLELTQGSLGMKGAIEKAKEILKSTPDSYMPGQFENMVNPAVHFNTTGPEIYEDTDGQVDILVAGVGTGGTLSGAGKYLKKLNPKIKVVAVEPALSPVLSKGTAGSHKIQGIGAGFIPKTLDTSVYDEIITVENNEAFETAKEIAKIDGVLVGISAGAAVYAARKLSLREENFGKKIVVILPDTGERYLSTQAFM